MAHEIGRRLGATREVRLGEDIAEVVFYCFVAQIKIIGDLLIGLPFGHEGQDLPHLSG